MTDQEWYLHEARRRYIRNKLGDERIAYSKGLTEGEARGEARGKFASKMEVAGNLLDQGVGIDMVCTVTGLDKTVVVDLSAQRKIWNSGA